MQHRLTRTARSRYLHTAADAVTAALKVLDGIEMKPRFKDRMRYELGLLIPTFRIVNLRHSTSTGNLHIDMNRSGFPNVVEIRMAEQLQAVSSDVLDTTIPLDALKEQWVSSLGDPSESSDELLRAIRQRHLYEELRRTRLFTACSNISDPVVLETGLSRQNSILTWAGYDPAREIPFVYSMQYESDTAELVDDELKARLKKECYWRHAGIVGAVVDEGFDSIHPKEVNAFGLRRLVTQQTLVPGDEWSELLRDHGSENSAILFLRHEVARSYEEVEVYDRRHERTITRERWYTPPGYRKLRDVLAFAQHDVIVMPHSVLQQVASRMKVKTAKITTFEELGI